MASTGTPPETPIGAIMAWFKPETVNKGADQVWFNTLVVVLPAPTPCKRTHAHTLLLRVSHNRGVRLTATASPRAPCSTFLQPGWLSLVCVWWMEWQKGPQRPPCARRGVHDVECAHCHWHTAHDTQQPCHLCGGLQALRPRWPRRQQVAC